MSGGITVKEFKHIPGVNDAEYIKKLEELQEIDKRIISKAVAKIKMLSAQTEPIKINIEDFNKEDWERLKKEWENTPITVLPEQPEQQWIPVTEIPPRRRDLMLKIYDKHNLFYYYHMGFHDGEKYYTYNFFWWEDKDLEIVGWQLCPWEEGEQE